MNTTFMTYRNFIQTQKNKYRLSEQKLIAEARNDDASFYKIRINICDIFSTLLSQAMKQPDEKAVCWEYLSNLEKIPSAWQNRLELAEKNNDVAAVAVEETQLDTARLLKNEFTRLIGGNCND